IAEQCRHLDNHRVRVLDLAAGHGLFGIAVAERLPQAQITAQDWPNVLEVAHSNSKQARVATRYRLLPGSVFDIDLGEGYEVVLLTNLLHHFDQHSCTQILRKIHTCLSDKGLLINLEFVPNEDRVSPPIPATFSLMMLGLTSSGDAYTARQHERMLSDAGFKKLNIIPVPRSPQHLIISTKRIQT
ncbi:MAG TPA: class I SAM-dependent methyltransferase, partial [Terriglobales bacterium]